MDMVAMLEGKRKVERVWARGACTVCLGKRYDRGVRVREVKIEHRRERTVAV